MLFQFFRDSGFVGAVVGPRLSSRIPCIAQHFQLAQVEGFTFPPLRDDTRPAAAVDGRLDPNRHVRPFHVRPAKM